MTTPEEPEGEPADYSTPTPQQPPQWTPPPPPPYGTSPPYGTAPPYGAPAPPPYAAPPPPPPSYAAPGYGPPGQPPPGYYQQPAPWAYAPARRTNGFAIASLVCGAAGFVTGCTAPLAIIFGLVARSQIKNTREEGNGMAIAGIILGSLVIVGIALIILLAVSVGNSSGPNY